MSESPAKVVLDLNDLFPMKASVDMVREKLAHWDTSVYRGQPVQIRGCSPTWAHLLVAGKLVDVAASLEFLLDDGKGGIPIPFYPNSR